MTRARAQYVSWCVLSLVCFFFSNFTNIYLQVFLILITTTTTITRHGEGTGTRNVAQTMRDTSFGSLVRVFLYFFFFNHWSPFFRSFLCIKHPPPSPELPPLPPSLETRVGGVFPLPTTMSLPPPSLKTPRVRGVLFSPPCPKPLNYCKIKLICSYCNINI